MRVSQLSIRRHPGFGDLDIDFRGENGEAARLVVIAGENGCGKTAVLETIYSALIPVALMRAKFRDTIDAFFRVNVETIKLSAEVGPSITSVSLDGSQFRKNPNQASRQVESTHNGQVSQLPPDILQRYGRENICFYSEANVTFIVPPIQSVGVSAGRANTKSLVPEENHPLRGGADLAGKIAQLFVDLRTEDNNDLRKWIGNNPGISVPPEILDIRMRRFSEAFEYMFPNKRLVDVTQEDGEFKVIFDEDGRSTSLANLSTGEKQIVFRGAFLLRNLEDLPGAVILIDEPELSLHPDWQARIMGFYEKIVGDDPERPGQIIIATHSPFVVHGTPTAKHIILQRNKQTNSVQTLINPTYPAVTSTEVAISTFDLGNFVSASIGKRLAVAVEGPTDKSLITQAWLKLRPGQSMPFVIYAAGGARPVQQLISGKVGEPSLLLEILAGAGVDRAVGIFDFDHEGYSQWNGAIKEGDAEEVLENAEKCLTRKRRGSNTWSALLPVPSQRAGYASKILGSDSILTIEHLFQDAEVANMLTVRPAVGSVGSTVLKASDKQKHAIASAAQNFGPAAFLGFEPILTFLEGVLAKNL